MKKSRLSSNQTHRDFRRALGQFPTGVTVVTTTTKSAEPIGVTASSFNSVSVDPPLILWSVDKNNLSLDAIKNAKYFTVNVLSTEQVEVSNRFAIRGDDKFADLDHDICPNGTPLIKHSAAQFECETWNIYDGGDHLIIVGRVLNYRFDESKNPLVFSRGSYAVSMQHPSSAVTRALRSNENSVLDDFILYLLRQAYTQCAARLYPEFMSQHGIAPEEWRTLAVLEATNVNSIPEIAKAIGQPIDIFHSTAARLQQRDLVNLDSQDRLLLTTNGRTMTHQLLAIVAERESKMLIDLNESERALLKQWLRHITQSAGRH